MQDISAPVDGFSGEGQWDLPRRAATIDEVLLAFDPLLEAVLLQLGAAADRDALIAQLDATLGFTAREAALPLAHIAPDDGLRHELAVQAGAIARHIVAAAGRISAAGESRRRHGEAALRALNLRSHCDGHVWRGDVAAQLMGPAGGAGVMQLYNEWLHQIVLLRDSLIPFANWSSLPLPLHRLAGHRGLRALEEPRRRFVGDLLSRRIEHGTLVAMAQALFGLAGEGGYGFVVDGIAVLPAVVGDDIATAPKGLLAWGPARIDGLDPAGPFRLDYAADDYYALARTPVGPGADRAGPRQAVRAHLAGRIEAPHRARVDIVVGAARADLGQALRGHRFAYRPGLEPQAVGAPVDRPAQVRWHDAAAILAAPGLVDASDGVHVVGRTGDALADLALLGKIYPENTVLRGGADWDSVLRSGKRYGARFVVQAMD
jgi:hypothetical protein